MSNLQDILQSFKINETLNPKVWENSKDPSNAKLKKEIRDGLLDIADKFVEYLGEDVFVEDVVLTGSLSNYNWSNYSDFDLHILIDMDQFDSDKELYKELFNLKKQIFNDKHNIKIKGFDVELYAQDTEEKHVSGGQYSVKDDEWINKPKKEKFDIDKDLLESKINSWKNKISKAIEESDSKKLEIIKDKLKEYRQCGLDKNGELSYENLVFKFLRRSGDIEKLFKELNKSVDKELSIENMVAEQSIIDKIKGLLPDKPISIESLKELIKKIIYPSKEIGNNSKKLVGKKGNFTYLDMNTTEGYNAYKDIANNFINKRNPNSQVNGTMLADSAKKYYNQGYVPPELALSQLALEGGLSKNPNDRPIRTKNPYNVGNVDSGKNVFRSSFQNGVDVYFDLMTRKYLNNKKPEDLLNNFVNFNGNRYASSDTYEKNLKNIISGMDNYTTPILSKYGLNKSDDV